MKRTASLLLLALLLSGCDLLGSEQVHRSGALSYRFETEASRFAADERIAATLTNRSAPTLYAAYQGCTLLGLERRADGAWESVALQIMCTAEARPPLSVAPFETIQLALPAQIVEASDLTPGTHRLTLAISASEDGEYERIVSNRFEVTYDE